MAKKKIPEVLSKHLTPEKRELFESHGREVVEQEVANDRHWAPADRYAALAWLAEQRQEEEQKNTARHWLLFTVGVLMLLSALLGVAMTIGVL